MIEVENEEEIASALYNTITPLIEDTTVKIMVM
jgi:hypothetical protein